MSEFFPAMMVMGRFGHLRMVVTAVVALWAMAAGAQRAVLTGRVKPIANLPQRSADATPYDKWMRQCDTTEFWTREDLIVKQVLSGNVPDSLRHLHEITFTTPIVDSGNQRDGSFGLLWTNPDVDVLSFKSFFVSLHCWNGFGG